MDSDSILATTHLRLRYQRKEDTSFLLDLWTDPEMTKYTGGPRGKDLLLNEFRKVAHNPREEEYDLWILVNKESNELVGQAGFIPKTIEQEVFIELNYYIRKAEWGKGYGTEIADKLKEYAFKVKGQESIIAIIGKGNEASKRVAEKIGMRYWKTVERESGEKLIYRVDKEGTRTARIGSHDE